MDFWLVWEYAAILLSVLSGLKDPLLCLPPPPCATPPFSGEKRVALHEHSAAAVALACTMAAARGEAAMAVAHIKLERRSLFSKLGIPAKRQTDPHDLAF